MADVNVEPDRVRPARKARRPRVFYTAGPGNLIGAFRNWRAGVDHPTEVAVTYSSLVFDVCERLDAEVVAVAGSAGYPKAEEFRDGPYRVRQVPNPWELKSGAGYQIGECLSDLRLIASAIRFGADVVLLHGGYFHWYLFSILRPFGIEVVPVMMVVPWTQQEPPGPIKRFIWRLNGRFFRGVAAAVMSASEACSRQVREVAGGRPVPIEPFLPKYRSSQFDGLEPPPPPPPFRVLYAGRIERYKGVFDLLEVARRFAEEGRHDVEFDLCGAGSMLDELRGDVEEAGLGGRFRLHGHCDQATMRRMYGASHAVIAPTRTDFCEGFNQVVAEAAIAGKPIVTSSVCPALELVQEAAVEVPPDDVRAYGDAILRLRDDPAFYAEKLRATPEIRAKFLGSDLTFDAVFGRILERVLERRGLLDPR